MIQITFSGRALENRGSAEEFISDLKGAINRAAQEAVESESRQLTDRIVSAYQNQSLPHKKLNPEYLKQKKSQGFDTRIGFKTGSMVRSIRFFKESKTKFFIGIKRQRRFGRQRTTQQLNIPQYAKLFEFGGRKQAARPVFQPLLTASEGRYRRALERNIKAAIDDVAGIWGGR